MVPGRGDGQVRKFDDLPEADGANVDTEPPFGRKPGDDPALSPAEIADIVVVPGDPDGRLPAGAAERS